MMNVMLFMIIIDITTLIRKYALISDIVSIYILCHMKATNTNCLISALPSKFGFIKKLAYSIYFEVVIYFTQYRLIHSKVKLFYYSTFPHI